MRYEFTDKLLSIGSVNLIYRCMLIAEILVHLLGFTISIVFIRLMHRHEVFHINLRRIMRSFCWCFVFTSVMRSLFCTFTILFLDELMFVESDSTLDSIEDFLIKARDTGLYAGSLHMLLLAVERLVATVRSRLYENERHTPYVYGSIATLWFTSFLLMFHFKDGKFTQYLFAGVHAFCDFTSIVVMSIVYKLNYRSIVAGRGSLQISHGYQVRENISSSSLLYRIFVIMTSCTVLGLAFFVGYVYFDEALLFRLFGFGFDVTCALATSVVPFLIIMSNQRLKNEATNIWNKWTGRCNEIRTADTTSTTHFIDYAGKKVPLKVANEQKTYFEQYSAQWARAPPRN